MHRRRAHLPRHTTKNEINKSLSEQMKICSILTLVLVSKTLSTNKIVVLSGSKVLFKTKWSRCHAQQASLTNNAVLRCYAPLSDYVVMSAVESKWSHWNRICEWVSERSSSMSESIGRSFIMNLCMWVEKKNKYSVKSDLKHYRVGI